MKDLLKHTLDCIHCGLCLPACPTYDVLKLETDSPRGRIHLVRAVAEQRISEPEQIQVHLDQCLGCRACETACPSGVRYGHILEQARAELPHRGGRLRKALLRHVVARPGRLRFAFSALRLAEVLGLRRLTEALRLAPTRSRDLLPRVPERRNREPIDGVFEPHQTCRGTVALFTGCVMSELFGKLNRTTLELLRQQGFRVVVPKAQVCCGALHRHDGDAQTADRLAADNERVFAELQVDAIIHNSAGCGAAMKEGDGVTASKSQDVCEFLDHVGLNPAPPAQPQPTTIVYDDPCHLCHGQGVRSAPRRLLQQIDNVTLRRHDTAEDCCGSAGIYNLTQPTLSQQIGERKAKALIASGADIVVTGNPGCLLQVQAHLRALKSDIRVVHPVELLSRSNN